MTALTELPGSTCSHFDGMKAALGALGMLGRVGRLTGTVSADVLGQFVHRNFLAALRAGAFLDDLGVLWHLSWPVTPSDGRSPGIEHTKWTENDLGMIDIPVIPAPHDAGLEDWRIQ